MKADMYNINSKIYINKNILPKLLFCYAVLKSIRGFNYGEQLLCSKPKFTKAV